MIETIDAQILYFGARSGGKTTTFMEELENHPYFKGVWKVEPNWKEVTNTLGNIKGVVSIEGRQLLKIALNLSDESVDDIISEYKKQYKLYLKDSKMYGKEKWKSK